MADPNVLRDRIAAAILACANSSLNSNDWLYEHDAENYADAVMAVVDAALDQAVIAGRRQAVEDIWRTHEAWSRLGKLPQSYLDGVADAAHSAEVASDD
ncbi:MAG TPA: hypothetical protein VFY84_04820 [Jiangellales bacterium]|nr:hypothetical protein [Jiangellales bacterium]